MKGEHASRLEGDDVLELEIRKINFCLPPLVDRGCLAVSQNQSIDAVNCGNAPSPTPG